MLVAAVYLGALVATACAAAVPYAANGHVLHESRTSNVNRHWKRNSRVDANAIIPVRIALKQQNIDVGAERLLEISDPLSSKYGKHLKAGEVHDLFAPPHDVVSAVREWLVDSGVDPRVIAHSDNRGWFAIDISAQQAERLFQSELHEYEHSRSGRIRIGCDSYKLPVHLKHCIDFITPGVKFSAPLKKIHTKTKRSLATWPHPRPGRPRALPMPKGPWITPAAAGDLPEYLKACGVNITPPCLRALYGLPIASINDSLNSFGLYEQGDYYAQGDLDSYYASFEPRIPQGTAPVLKGIDGGYAPVPVNSSLNTGESDIDLDITMALIYPQSITLYQVDDFIYGPEEVALDNTFNTFLDALDGSYCNYSAYGITGDSPGIDPTYPDNSTGGYNGTLQCGVYKPTRVISASYGESEGDFPKAYIERQCNEFMKLSLQGHTIFVSSSDFGVGNFPDDLDPNGCLSASGQSHDINGTVYNPDYPAGCPWITTVGATALYSNQTILDKESAMQVDLWSPGDSNAYHYFSSSGGFSNVFTTASYQQSAVAKYFANHDPGHSYYIANANETNIGANGGIYNRAGRGYPDVSANGAYMLAYDQGEFSHWFGTSLASPIWASVITLVNQQRTINGKGPVGFINPTLYANTWALNDIVNGSNPNCGSSGFSAVSGWDPVTGLGTPNYPKLLELFLSLP
ncbi:subtilisin-like protein [Teratosphaeria nubilosa]|uniref:Subtilisin-like protein n=1 Tax=Teratosphaeria nubilosa TaxID=161662 RepID=A0A6G1KUU2_9PEZI|nr:subtilisin-like protein [Teratosphaeria nubilosa]